MLFLYCVLLFSCLVMLVAGVVEQRRHYANLAHIPNRVLVNGIRGKSSITRLCAGALRGGGLVTVAKTTGTAARFIHPDATEEPVHRKFGIANVVEQIGIVRRAAAYRPHALVMECMAVMPALQEINQSKLIQSTIGVLCNVREDHVAEMGPTLDDIARSLSRSMPHGGICVTAERERFHVLQEEADARDCTLVYADPDTVGDDELRGFSWFTFKENVAIALTVAELLGIDRETALQGMYDAPPDPGVLSVERYVAPGGKRLRFANVFAANDPESTLMNINQLLDLGAVDRPLNVVINCRPDRVERNGQMGAIIPDLMPDKVFVIGHPAKSAIDAIPAEWRGRAVDLGGDQRDGEEFMNELLGHLSPSSSLVAIGNIHGQGEILLEHLAELPGFEDEPDEPDELDRPGRAEPYGAAPDREPPYPGRPPPRSRRTCRTSTRTPTSPPPRRPGTRSPRCRGSTSTRRSSPGRPTRTSPTRTSPDRTRSGRAQENPVDPRSPHPRDRRDRHRAGPAVLPALLPDDEPLARRHDHPRLARAHPHRGPAARRTRRRHHRPDVRAHPRHPEVRHPLRQAPLRGRRPHRCPPPGHGGDRAPDEVPPAVREPDPRLHRPRPDRLPARPPAQGRHPARHRLRDPHDVRRPDRGHPARLHAARLTDAGPTTRTARSTPMTAKSARRTHPVLHAAVVALLLAGSAYFTYELRKEEQAKAPAVLHVTDRAHQVGAQEGAQKWERLKNPERSVLRGADGAVLATFTDGARTASLTGKSRTFTEPATTTTRVVTETWVRLLPEGWRPGAEREQWFQDWFKKYYGSEEDDLFAIAFQYGDQAPVKKDAAGVQYAGDAIFGPLNPNGSEGNDLRLEQSDFYDYLGIPYTFRNGTTERPEKAKHRALDCSGFIRTVFGYRGRFP